MARALYEQCLDNVKQLVGFKTDIPFYLEGLAAVVAAQGELPWAARLWGTAEALREGMGAPIHPADRADYERSVAAARTQLGEQVFAATWSEGRMMSLEQVLAAKGPVEIPVLISGKPPSTPPMWLQPASPAGLTMREMEVLRLLAQGLTSAQIAEHLTLSVLTVNTHLRSIYSKLGVTSRSAATRWAMEQHLV
jgi:DNA-binding NarL/FixJ family response regulator